MLLSYSRYFFTLKSSQMIHSAKNTTENKTAHWIAERAKQVEYYNSCPSVGGELGVQMYETMKKAIPSIIQASACGVVISVVTYKQDADKAAYLLGQSFKKPIRQTVCPYTDFVTTFLINR